MAKETGWFLTEGGSIIEMDLPLAEGIAQRVEKGAITRVANAKGEPLEAPKRVHDTSLDLTSLYAPPAESSNKTAWVMYAVQHGGMTQEGANKLTKADLVKRFGEKLGGAENEPESGAFAEEDESPEGADSEGSSDGEDSSGEEGS